MFGRTPIWIATGLLLVALPIYGQDNAASAQPAQAHSAPDVAGGPKTSGTTDPNYVIGPQDLVDISVWKEGRAHAIGSGPPPTGRFYAAAAERRCRLRGTYAHATGGANYGGTQSVHDQSASDGDRRANQ